MGDNDFLTSDFSEEDELPRCLLPEGNGATETLDLSNLLTKDLTSSGSFEMNNRQVKSNNAATAARKMERRMVDGRKNKLPNTLRSSED